MRFKTSILLTVLALLGGAGLFVARFALAQQPRGVPPVVQLRDGDKAEVRDAVLDPRPTTGVPVLVETPYAGRLFVQSTGHKHDDQLAELVQLDANLAQQSQQLIDQYGAATDDADRAKLKEQLAQTLERQFDSQQKLRELEVSRIETRLKTLRELIAKRNESKRSIIGKRLDQLIGDAEGLGWSSPGVGAGPAIQYQSGGYLVPH